MDELTNEVAEDEHELDDATLESALEGAARVKGEAFVQGSRVARAELTYVLMEVDVEKVHQQREELYQIWTERLRAETTER